MNKCNICKVSVHPQHEFCPLCGKRLGKQGQSETLYPRYITAGSKPAFILKKILLFLWIAVSTVTIFINIFTFEQFPRLWSVLVSLSFAFLWRSFRIVQTHKISIGRKILYGYGIVSAFLIVLDVYAGFLKWSTTYVIPFLTVFVTAVLTVLAVRSNKKLREYLGNLIAIFFISLCPAIIYLFSLSAQAWSSLIALLYCLLTVAGLIIFMDESFKEEIKKKFHY